MCLGLKMKSPALVLQVLFFTIIVLLLSNMMIGLEMIRMRQKNYRTDGNEEKLQPRPLFMDDPFEDLSSLLQNSNKLSAYSKIIVGPDNDTSNPTLADFIDFSLRLSLKTNLN